MNHTIARGTPENINKAVELLDTPEVLDAFRSAAGFRAVYLVLNQDDPHEVISVSVWDSAAEGQAFYAGLVSEPPKYKQFDVKVENVLEARPA